MSSRCNICVYVERINNAQFAHYSVLVRMPTIMYSYTRTASRLSLCVVSFNTRNKCGSGISSTLVALHCSSATTAASSVSVSLCRRRRLVRCRTLRCATSNKASGIGHIRRQDEPSRRVARPASKQGNKEHSHRNDGRRQHRRRWQLRVGCCRRLHQL